MWLNKMNLIPGYLYLSEGGSLILMYLGFYKKQEGKFLVVWRKNDLYHPVGKIIIFPVNFVNEYVSDKK